MWFAVAVAVVVAAALLGVLAAVIIVTFYGFSCASRYRIFRQQDMKSDEISMSNGTLQEYSGQI